MRYFKHRNILTGNLEPKSKRVPVRLRHKIEKASAAKQRKEKKAAKKVQQPRNNSRLVLTHTEPGMAIQVKEGSGHSQPFPLQGQDSGRS
jgi:hypothetical protein